MTKKICTKYKQHKLAQHGADVFVSNKLLTKFYEEKRDKEVDLLKELNSKVQNDKNHKVNKTH